VKLGEGYTRRGAPQFAEPETGSGLEA
jgi:hypothetical protein